MLWTWKQIMQTACSLVTASARGTNASISGKGSRWKVPSRAATRTIFPLKNSDSFSSLNFTFLVLSFVDQKLHLFAISSHQLTMSGKNWPSSIPITSYSLDRIVNLCEVFEPGVCISVLATTFIILYGWRSWLVRRVGANYSLKSKIFTLPSHAIQRACWLKQLVAPAPKVLSKARWFS